MGNNNLFFVRNFDFKMLHLKLNIVRGIYARQILYIGVVFWKMEEGFFSQWKYKFGHTNTYLYHYHTCTLLITVVSNQKLDWVLYTCSTINIWTFRMKKSSRLGDKKKFLPVNLCPRGHYGIFILHVTK